MIDAAYVKELFPEFGSEQDSRVNLFISIAALSVDSSVWDTLTDPATGYLTAHLLAMSKRGASGGSGPVTSEKVGDLARGYGQLSILGSEELASTAYGIEFLRLRRMLVTSPLVVC
jgi:hypothetical protein